VRFVVLVEVRGGRDGGWFRRVIEAPCDSEDAHMLHAGVRLRRARSSADEGGGVRVVCQPLEGEHYALLLHENLFERCPPPIGYHA
jgi:hypothetical protein